MAFFEVCVTADCIVRRDQMDPDDRKAGPVGEYYVELEASDGNTAEELGLDWFHDHHAVTVPEHYRITAHARRQYA
jgi:hypothetical protein